MWDEFNVFPGGPQSNGLSTVVEPKRGRRDLTEYGRSQIGSKREAKKRLAKATPLSVEGSKIKKSKS